MDAGALPGAERLTAGGRGPRDKARGRGARRTCATSIRFDYARVVSDPGILGGTPVIKGTRISVGFVLDLFASGATRPEILQAYPHLTTEDIEEALRYAADVLKHDRVIPLGEPSA